MAHQITGKKPKNFWFTFKALLSYMGRHKFLFLAVAVLVTLSALGNLLGTYMIRPVVNSVGAGDVNALARGVILTAVIFAIGALAAFGYTQTMVYAAQKVLYDIRRDLFAHIQSLPLRFFDTQLHGDIMSYFTNDVDTVSDALNNSFAMTIQSFIQIVGTLTLLFILNWRLSLIVVVGYAAMFLYIRFSAGRSTSYYTTQQAALGTSTATLKRWSSGQKVVKVFNHEPENLRVFGEKNEVRRKAGTGAQSYAATMVPAVVSISYINYAIVAVVGGLMVLNGMTDHRQPVQLSGVVRQAALPINQFTPQSNLLLAAMAGAERIFEAMRLAPEVDEGKVQLVNVREETASSPPAGEKTGRLGLQKPDGTLVPLRGDVRFHDVSFGYDKGHTILHNVSLYAKPGQKIAFVGSTGAGKTTITNLINGSTTLIRAASPTTASTSGTSPRIPCGAPWASCSRTPTCSPAPLRTTSVSASWTQPGRRSSRQPGLPTRIPSSGACPRAMTPGSPRTAPACPKASGSCWPLPGRRWRPAGADPGRGHQFHRHPHRGPDRKGMDRLMEGRTVFVIAHRLSTVRNANAIMVLEHGQIVERGDPRRPPGPKGRILPALQRHVRTLLTYFSGRKVSKRLFNWYHRLSSPHKAPPATNSCSLDQAPGLRPCESNVSSHLILFHPMIKKFSFRLGRGFFMPGDLGVRGPFLVTVTPHGRPGGRRQAASPGGFILPPSRPTAVTPRLRRRP